jgi:hypothetical protein
LSLNTYCIELCKVRRLCRDNCHTMRSSAQKKAKNQAFNTLSKQEKHKIRVDYLENNFGISGRILEEKVVQNHWISLGHQAREVLSIQHMKKTDNWTRISNKFGEKYIEDRVRSYQTWEGKKFSDKELELE